MIHHYPTNAEIHGTDAEREDYARGVAKIREVRAAEDHACVCDHCREAGTCFGCDSGVCP